MTWLRVLLVSGIVLPCDFFALNVWEVHDAEVRQTDLRLTATVRLLREQVSTVMLSNQLAISLTDKMLGTLTWDEIAKSDPLAKQMYNLDESLPQIESIVVMNPDDFVANSSHETTWPHNITLADRPWIVAMRNPNGPKVLITPIYLGRRTHRMQFSMIERRSSPDGRYNGLIILSINPDFFHEISHGFGRKDRFTLARDDGIALATYPPDNMPEPIPPALIQRLDQEEIVRTENFILSRVPGFPLIVSYAINDSTTRNLWNAEIAFAAATVLVGSAIVSVTCMVALRSYARERDTSAQLQIEMQRRQEAEAASYHSRRLEALGQLTAGVAHDFNNLLTVVIGNAEQITMMGCDGSKPKANNILTAAQRGATLVAQMLTFSRRQVIQAKRYDVGTGLRQFVPLITSTLKPTVKLNMAMSSAPLICYVDASEFELAVLNIVSNADHAMPSGGQLTIKSEVVTRYGEQFASHRSVRIAFEDTGIGMTEETRERAFEPFFTTRSQQSGGTGLGLSQVYGFAKQAGGDVAIESEFGRGTKVIVYLPMNEPQPLKGASERTSTIVVVDDQKDILEILGPALEMQGFAVFCTQDPAEALSFADNNDCTLLLTDVVMPAMSGTDLAKRMVANHAEVRILLMTGFAADVQSFPVIRKPFRMHELLSRIRNLLDERRARWAP